MSRIWSYPRLIAHRGGGTLAPENTLAGMRLAHAYGYLAVEFDVMLSADQVPILMHDAEFGRTVAGRGQVARHLAADLTAMDAGSWHSPAYAAEPVPTLVDVHAWLVAAGMLMNVEIKPAPGFDAITGEVVGEVLQRLQGDSSVMPLLSSFSVEALQAALSVAPALPRAMLWRTIPKDWRRRVDSLECVAVHCHHQYLTESMASNIKRQGLGLMCYTVNDPARANLLFDWGVDAICTDRLDLFAARPS